MKLRYLLLFVILLASLARGVSQGSMNNTVVSELIKENARKTINIPDLEDLITLKGDFHMHTVFSDGMVWPTVRVQEAWEDGLDVISITDHVENWLSKKELRGDDNSSYDIALPEARKLDIMLVKGTEITKDMPPGHFNAYFIEDANKLDVKDGVKAIEEAHKQGAFVIWNHPGWKPQQPDTCIRFEIHNELIRKGMVQGIEVFNYTDWYPVALNWCIRDKLSVFGNSDEHGLIKRHYPIDSWHRPMTLVFARERSLEGVREAFENQRTAAWFGKILAGPEAILNELFEESVTIIEIMDNDGSGKRILELNNRSDFHFDFEITGQETNSLTLRPNETTLLKSKPGKFEFAVVNWYVDMDKNLEVKLNP